MTAHLDVTDSAALTAALEAVPLHHWAEVTTPDGERHLVQRVPGGWHLPGDMAVASADVADGEPVCVEVLGDDGHLPAGEAIELARAELARARAEGDAEAAETLAREMDDLDSVGWAQAGRLRDEALAWLAGRGAC